MKRTAFVLALSLLGGFSATSIQAAVYNVTRTDDPTPPLVAPYCVAGDCSLREAVLDANVSGDASNEINLPAGDYRLTITGDDEDSGFTGDLDVLNHDLTINGAAANTTSINGSALADRILQVPSSQTGNDIDLVLSGLTFTGGNPSAATDNDGGAISFLGNTGVDSLTLNDSVVSGNTSVDGGGIVATGDVTLFASTISDNTASASGGGLSVGASIFKMTNSTISGNSAGTDGGGISTGFVNFTSASNTIFDNDAAGNGGGVNIVLGTFNISNTILSGNMAAADTDCGGGGLLTFTSGGYNIFGDIAACSTTPAATDQSITNPADLKLGALANYGGTTLTHTIAADSPAVDGGNPADCLDADGLALTEDQRGQARAADGNNDSSSICDVGAFELGLSNLKVEKTADQSKVESGDTLTYTLTVTNQGPNTNFNIVLTDALPGNVSFVSAESDDPADTCSEALGAVTCQLGEMPNAGQDVVTIVVQVDSGTSSETMTNNATVTGTENDPTPADSSATLVTEVDGGGGCSLAGGASAGSFGAWLVGAVAAIGAMRFGPRRR